MLGHFFYYYYLNNMKTIRISNHETIVYLQQNIDNKCLNLKIVKFDAQNELISNLMPATHLKIVGTGACLPWCSISSSFQNSLKMSGYRGYEFWEFLCWDLVQFGPFLPDRFPTAEEFVFVFDVFCFNDVPNVLYR